LNENQKKLIRGFSKLTKQAKLDWIITSFFNKTQSVYHEMSSFWLQDDKQQQIIDGFSENTVSNFILPYSVCPNLMVNDNIYCVPMVTEESSVVAAAASAAKFWLERGGFKTQILGTQKIGQVHIKWDGSFQELLDGWQVLEPAFRKTIQPLVHNMEQRGGGVKEMSWKDFTNEIPGYYQAFVKFETCDSMGANFINTILEELGKALGEHFNVLRDDQLEVIMCILSNYTPDCLVRVSVSCPVSQLKDSSIPIDAEDFASLFNTAIRIAEIDPYRATTHNKGIFNGIDAVVIATGNDFRAVEACGHTYAARSGSYSSLSHCNIEHGIFEFWMDFPMAVGTVGGLTKLHPLAQKSNELLGNPSAETLMQIIAATGLAQNFAAIRSLVTTGIQKGHMKMHLQNILQQLSAADNETELVLQHFEHHVVSFNAVRTFLQDIRNSKAAQLSN